MLDLKLLRQDPQAIANGSFPTVSHPELGEFRTVAPPLKMSGHDMQGTAPAPGLGADTLEKVLPKMKQEACKAGGDAIILGSSQKTVDIYEDLGDDQLNVTATVIRWKE